MLYACAARFDVTGNLENFLFLGELNKAHVRRLEAEHQSLSANCLVAIPFAVRGLHTAARATGRFFFFF